MASRSPAAAAALVLSMLASLAPSSASPAWAAPTGVVATSTADRVYTLQPATDWPAWAGIGPSRGTTRQVSPAGSDSGDGSAARPFRSIQAALDVSSAGDEVAIAAGEYPGAVRIRQPNITLRGSYGVNKPHIVVPSQDENNDLIAVELDPDADGARIIGLDIQGGSYYALSCETKWDWGDPSDRSGATGVVIAYNDLHHSGRDAIKVKPNCDDILIADNTIHHTGQRDDSNAEGIDNVNGDRMTVLDNHLYDIATTGLYFKGGAMDARVERNLIERVGRGTSPDSAGAGILVGFDTDTDYFDRVANPGMYEAIGARVINNIVDGTTMTGIGVYAARDSVIAHNTIRNCCRDYHAGIAFGLSLQSWQADGLRPASRNVTVWGNLVGVASSARSDYGSAIRYLDEPQLGQLSAYDGMPIMDYNVYFPASGTALFSDGRPGLEYDDAGLAGWAGHIGAESHSRTAAFALDAQWVPDLAAAVDAQGRFVLTTDFYRQPRPAAALAGAVQGTPPPQTGPPPGDGVPATAPGGPRAGTPIGSRPRPGAKPRPTVAVSAARCPSRLRVAVAPNLGSSKPWVFRVQVRRSGKAWRTVGTSHQTRGTTRKHARTQSRTLRLQPGNYRIRVPAQHGYRAAASRTVTLRRGCR